MSEHDRFWTIVSIIVAILFGLGVWGTYNQLQDERIKNSKQKSEYEYKYTPSKP